MSSDDNYRPQARDGGIFYKVLGTAFAGLLVVGISGLFGAWAGLVQLRAEFDSFRAPGDRFTGSQGAELSRRITACERRLESLHDDYTAHQAWGRQWARETERRIESVERSSGMNGYWQRELNK